MKSFMDSALNFGIPFSSFSVSPLTIYIQSSRGMGSIAILIMTLSCSFIERISWNSESKWEELEVLVEMDLKL